MRVASLLLLAHACRALGLASPLAHSLTLSVRGGTRAAFSLFASSVRPSLDDVERISRGDAARRRGTGSRAVPHRLNEMERAQWDLAKRKRFLVLRGSGWRKERGDSPLANIYRQFCDALEIPSISVCQGLGSGSAIEDQVVVDFSPLRRADIADLAQQCLAEAREPRYPSVLGVEDGTSVDVQGLDEHFRSDAIWRVPVLALVVRFADRAESKLYAETLALRMAKQS